MRHLPAEIPQFCFPDPVQALQELTQSQLLTHRGLKSVILRALWVTVLHSLADTHHTLPALPLLAAMRHAAMPLNSAPFLSTPGFDVFLIPGDRPRDELDALVRLGVLTSYRYLDACNEPAFLGLRTRS